MNILLINSILPIILKYKLKNGVIDIIFEILGKHFKILVKKQGRFYSDFYDQCQFFFKKLSV